MDALDILLNAFFGTADWVWRNIIFEVPWNQNYFWGLTLISALVWIGELVFPWRKQQATFRKDFWLDACYMYFNFFVFSIVISGIYQSLSAFFAVHAGITMQSIAIIDIRDWPPLSQLILFFVLLDFLQWVTHRLLHRIELLWRFHQIHHSVKEMGFAAHLRYHWMENILYKPLKTLGLMLLGGFEPEQAYIVHFAAITIGHLNHANIKLSYGPLKYILNNPVMHLYHHAYTLPSRYRYGTNFGISLSVWDYLFNSTYLPETSGRIALGFDGDQHVPKTFWRQLFFGFKKTSQAKPDTHVI